MVQKRWNIRLLASFVGLVMGLAVALGLLVNPTPVQAASSTGVTVTATQPDDNGVFIDPSGYYYSLKSIKQLINVVHDGGGSYIQLCMGDNYQYPDNIKDAGGFALESTTLGQTLTYGKYRTIADGDGGVEYIDTKTNSPFYTKDQFKEILAYAQSKNIQVVLNIESLSHTGGILRLLKLNNPTLYQQVVASGATSGVPDASLINDHTEINKYWPTLNPQAPATLTLMKDIIKEYAPLMTQYGMKNWHLGIAEYYLEGTEQDLINNYVNPLDNFLEQNYGMTAWVYNDACKQTTYQLLNKDIQITYWSAHGGALNAQDPAAASGANLASIQQIISAGYKVRNYNASYLQLLNFTDYTLKIQQAIFDAGAWNPLIWQRTDEDLSMSLPSTHNLLGSMFEIWASNNGDDPTKTGLDYINMATPMIKSYLNLVKQPVYPKIAMTDRTNRVKTISGQVDLTALASQSLKVTAQPYTGTATDDTLVPAEDIRSCSVNSSGTITLTLTATGLKKIRQDDDVIASFLVTDAKGDQQTINVKLYEPVDTWLPDKALQQAVMYYLSTKGTYSSNDALNVPTYQNAGQYYFPHADDLTKSALKALHYFNPGSLQVTNDIKDLTGLEYATNLQVLNLYREPQLDLSQPTTIPQGTGLAGWLHYWLAALPQLRELALGSDQLAKADIAAGGTGQLPTDQANGSAFTASDLGGLQIIDLSNNGLTGSLPASWGALATSSHVAGQSVNNLQYLALQQNQLTGAVPGSWANLAATLNSFSAYDNQLTGGLMISNKGQYAGSAGSYVADQTVSANNQTTQFTLDKTASGQTANTASLPLTAVYAGFVNTDGTTKPVAPTVTPVSNTAGITYDATKKAFVIADVSAYRQAHPQPVTATFKVVDQYWPNGIGDIYTGTITVTVSLP